MAIRDLIPFSRESAVPSMWRQEFGPVGSFRREMDRLFDEFFHSPALGQFGETGGNWTASYPRLDVNEKDDEVVITAEVPGMTDKDVDLFVQKGILTIRGEKKGEKEERGYSERFYGRFERQVPLPTSVDEAHCRAEFHDGLLTIHLPKTREAEADKKRIPINADTRH